MIDVTKCVTSIEVAPDEIPFRLSLASTTLQGKLAARHPTGARVTVEFARPAPIGLDSCVRVYYDIAENGELREMLGVPQLTHTTALQGLPGPLYHYRLSQWIIAASVMRFIPPPYVDGFWACAALEPRFQYREDPPLKFQLALGVVPHVSSPIGPSCTEAESARQIGGMDM